MVKITSKYNSRCKSCGGFIRKGVDSICKTDNGWVCEKCANGESSDAQSSSSENHPNISAAIGLFAGHTASDNRIIERKVASIGALPEDFKPSVQQQAIFDFIENGQRNAVIEAVAGSGKTTTIVEALKLTDKSQSVAFLAFNKHIATELQYRVPDHVHVSTLHSLGLANLRRENSRIIIDGRKLQNIIKVTYPTTRKEVPNGLVRKENRAKVQMLETLVSLAKATMVNYSSLDEMLSLINHYGVDLGEFAEELISKVPAIIETCKTTDYMVDFDDMIWMPIINNSDFRKFDFVFVDEAQDLNKSQAEFVKRSLADGGRIVAVGDRKQSLYGFRGADVKSIENLISEFDATVLPLSVTYRCPALHVALAKEIVPQIEAREGAADGVLGNLDEAQFMEKLSEGDMVICRTNAPLVAPAFELIRRGIKAIVRGRDIGAGLVNLIDRLGGETLSQLDVNLGEYLENETGKLLARDQRMAAEAVVDKVETIRVIMSSVNTVDSLKKRIQSIFKDENEGVVFSSVHKAKGLEAKKVYILRPDLMPHPKAEPGWQTEQEMNCKYVALTRAKEELYFVN